MCGMTVSQTRNSGTPDAFNLATGTTAPNAANPNTVTTTPTAAGVGATCTQEGIGKLEFEFKMTYCDDGV